MAVLAGVSADYYTRLEQGREQRPSSEVLHALSRALRLDSDERDHLFRLAEVGVVGASVPSTEVSCALRDLVDRLVDGPVLVLSHDLEVLVRNESAEALHSDFAIKDNFARMCFLDAAGPSFYRDWTDVAADVIGNLRFALGMWPDSASLVELVEELRALSVEFDRLWAAHTVRAKRSMTKRFHHSVLGDLDVNYQSFDVREAAGQQLVVIGARADSPTAKRLAKLRS